MDNHKIIPFYMTYPFPIFYDQEESVVRDLEYLQQMYPDEIKKYQRAVASILDKYDYAGSMIYDEYPDKWLLHKLAKDIFIIIKKEEDFSEEKEEWLGYLIHMLLFYEIYKKRHTRQRGILRF